MGGICRTPSRHHQRQAKARPLIRHLPFGAVLVAMLTLTSACTDRGSGAPLPSPPSATRPTATTTSSPAQPEEAAVVAQYRRYLEVSYTNWSSTERRARLAAVLVDPALSVHLVNLGRMDAAGEILFGRLISRDPRVAIDGNTATVVDCQDTSESGRRIESSGKVLSVGVPRVEATVTLNRGDDDIWRVSEVEYGSTSC